MNCLTQPMPPSKIVYYFQVFSVVFPVVLASFFCVDIHHATAKEPLVVTYRMSESESDERYDYDAHVLRMALDKTSSDWGEYTMVPSPRMNYARAMKMLYDGTLENAVFMFSATNELCRDLPHASFPADLGIVGYRLFFVPAPYDSEVSEVRTLNGLKKFTVGVGSGWPEEEIFRDAGFDVQVVPLYEHLFTYVALGRFQLLPRGINEVGDEYFLHKNIKGLTLNRSIGVYYPLPRFFFTSKDNPELAKRVEEGLRRGYADGTLQKQWEHEYRLSIEFARFNTVRFFKLDNPLISEIPKDYEKYFVTPEHATEE